MRTQNIIISEIFLTDHGGSVFMSSSEINMTEIYHDMLLDSHIL